MRIFHDCKFQSNNSNSDVAFCDTYKYKYKYDKWDGVDEYKKTLLNFGKLLGNLLLSTGYFLEEFPT